MKTGKKKYVFCLVRYNPNLIVVIEPGMEVDFIKAGEIPFIKRVKLR